MSDIGIFSDSFSVAMIWLIFGSPGIAVGAIVGALVWRAHRIWGALIGAEVGYGVCLGVVWIWVVR